MPSISLTQDQIDTALRFFLLGILPDGIEVVKGQENRVPEPAGANFVVFNITGDERLSTNIDEYHDCAFTASIAGTLMNVVSVESGEIVPGVLLSGPRVAPGTKVVSGTLTNGAGTLVVNVSQTVPLATLSAGSRTASQSLQLRIQIDVHGPDSSENARIITTMFRDTYAVEQFQASGIADVTPLYADDPKQLPYSNAEQQIEQRWVIDAAIQAVPVVQGLPQQFTSDVDMTTIRIS